MFYITYVKSFVLICCFFSVAETQAQAPPTNPCRPSPCSPNSQCRELNGHAVCSCLTGFVGTPPSCRPECVVSSDCAQDKTCINQKCAYPCPGTCGTNARCEVVNHYPICSCAPGFTGDPFLRCIKQEKKPHHDKNVVCYIASWATYRKLYPFTPEYIDPSLCTHLVYKYAGLKKDSQDAIVSYSPFTDLKENFGLDYYGKITSLKNKFPHLKVLLCIGGWEEGSINYSKLAESDKKRRDFVKNTIEYLREYNFDGLDIFWQFPAERGGKPEDKENFVKLLRDLKEEFVKHNFLLTVLLSTEREKINHGYDLPQIGQIVHWVNLYCHSLNSPWAQKFGINSPLDSKDGNNVKSIVNYYLDNGIPNSKLVVILSAVGYGFTNTDKPGKVDGLRGWYSDDKGYLTFLEICKNITDPKSGWKEIWDDASSTPIAVKGNNKISYENQNSIKMKVKFCDEKKLAGMGIWTIDADDFLGSCSLPGYGNEGNQSKFPLIKAINQEYESRTNNEILQPHDPDVTVTVVIHEY